MDRARYQSQRDQLSFGASSGLGIGAQYRPRAVELGERETERHTKTRKCFHHSEGTKTGYIKNVKFESSMTRPCTKILI